MNIETMKEFLQMYKSLSVLYDYDIIQHDYEVEDMKIQLLSCVMNEIEKVLNHLDAQKEGEKK